MSYQLAGKVWSRTTAAVVSLYTVAVHYGYVKGYQRGLKDVAEVNDRLVRKSKRALDTKWQTTREVGPCCGELHPDSPEHQRRVRPWGLQMGETVIPRSSVFCWEENPHYPDRHCRKRPSHKGRHASAVDGHLESWK